MEILKEISNVGDINQKVEFLVKNVISIIFYFNFCSFNI